MKTNQSSVADINVIFNSDKNVASLQFENEILTGHLLRNFMLAIGLPYSILNLPSYTQTDAVTPLIRAINDRAFLSVRDNEGNLASFVGCSKGWVTDEQFLDLCVQFEQRLGIKKDLNMSVLSGAVELKAAYLIDSSLSSIGDRSLYSSYFIITRLAEGGVSGDASLLRLACSNGMTVPTRFADHVKINSIADAEKFLSKATISSKSTLITAVDNQLFDPSGAPFMASVREFRQVSKLLDRYSDTPNQYLDRTVIDSFYAEKGYSSHIQNFPSGMTYFDVYNVATNVLSNKIEGTPLMDANIDLGNLLFSKRDASAGIQDVSFIPAFDNLADMRGDNIEDAVIVEDIVIDVKLDKKAKAAQYARDRRARIKAEKAAAAQAEA